MREAYYATSKPDCLDRMENKSASGSVDTNAVPNDVARERKAKKIIIDTDPGIGERKTFLLSR